MSSRVGERAPAHCTGLGKALLAHLPEETVRQSFAGGLRSYTSKTITRMDAFLPELANVRQAGYAIDDEEHEQGVMCIAAPVFDSHTAVAAISIAGPAERIREGIRHKDLTAAVLAAAEEVSTRLGRVAASPPSSGPPGRAPAARKKVGRPRR
jgi:DNA-binding IclR family transcriptional regulator